MRNTGGSGRSKSNKDKGSSKSQTQNTHTVKSEGPPLKTIQATAEQLALNNLIHGKEKDTEDTELKNKISQIVELTGCSQDRAEIALHDNQNDMDKAVNMVLEGNTDENEWKESGKKKKKQPKQEPIQPLDNNMDNKMDRRDHKDKTDKEGQDRDEFDNYRGNRDQQDNYKRRRNDNKPPRLSRGRGRSDRPDRAGDRPEREDDRDFNRDRGDFNKDRGFERGRGRGRGASRRGGRGAGSGTGTFRPPITHFEKPTTFDNGPQIDTWTNETAVMGEKEPKISNWGDSKDDWNEDIDSWSGSLAETKVFTASTTNPPEPQNPVQMPVENPLSNTFDLGVLYPKHPQNDISAEASYITQFNQQATESIKNSIGIGSRSSSLSSQTVSNVSALVSLQQNAVLHDNLGPNLNTNDLTANSLVGNGLGGSSLGTSGLRGTGLGSSGLGGSGLGTNDLGVANLGTNGLGGSNLGNSLSQSNMPGNSLTGNALDSSSLSVTSLTGVGLNGTGLANSLASVSQSINAASSIPSVSASQNALMQQRPKPQKSKCPPPSKIPASAVEMPGHMMAQLDVQFGNLEFGADSSPFSFGGNESGSSAYSTTASSSASTMNHANAQMGQDPLRAGNLEQNSPRNGGLYQPAYTTPTKQETATDNNTGMSPTDSLQMHGTTSDLKSNQLMSNQSQQGSLPSTKIDSSLNNYSAGSYQSAGYQSHKPGVGYSSSTKPGAYQGNQFQSGSNPNQPNSAQYSSQYRQSNQNQFSTGANQYQTGSQYQSPPSGYQSQTGYQSSQTGYQSNQSQYPSNPNQFQNFQSGSTFQNQSSYPTNQSPQNSLYQVPSTSYSSQTQSNSLYSQSASHTGSYSNQSYLNRDHSGGAGSSYPAAVTQSSSPFKDNQSGASSYRENSSTSKTNESQSEPSVYSRDSQSASNFSDSQSVAYNRDSQSVGDSYSSRDSGSSAYKRETKSASGSYPRDSQTSVIDNSAYNRDSQSSGGGSSFSTGRESQAYKDATSASGFRDAQTGSSTFSNQSNSYNHEPTQTGLASGASQTQTGYSAKNFSRNSQDLTSSTLQTSPLTGSKLTDNFSKMAVKEQSVDSRTTTSSQFDVTTTSSSKSAASTTSVTSLTSSTTVTSTSAATTVTSSNTTKISTFPTISAASSKAPPNPPPGVQLMTQQYIMGQAGTLPFYGVQPPLYANLEELQYFQQRMPPLPTNNVYDFANAAAAAGLGMPPTTLTSNSNQQTMPNVAYSGTGDSTKMTRVEAQSPTGSIPTSQQSATGQAHQQQPYFYSYIYPSSLIPGAGFQIPMIPMPQVTNAAHSGTPANTQYQQKSYSSHHVPYGTNKVYDDLTQQTPDFSKSPYGTAQTQPKANSGVTTGSASSDIQVPGYGKTHAQAFDKQGFHASTPPPFNLQMAAGQLGSGTQAGPLGAPTGPYGAPYGVPMMTHQPHSQMLHHHLQDTSSSSRGSQQTGSHTQSKTTSKSYTGSNWGTY